MDYPGAKQRLYSVRALRRQPVEQLGGGWEPGTFLGIYRDYTPEAAILTARADHQKTFDTGPVVCTDLSAWCRLVSGEVSACVYVVLHPSGEMERGQHGPAHPAVTAAQRPRHLWKAALGIASMLLGELLVPGILQI